MRVLVRLLAIALLLALGACGYFVYAWYHEPLPLPASPFAFEVKHGASLSAVARQLQGAGAIRSAQALIVLSRFSATDRTIKAGSYEIEQGITLRGLLAKLTQGDVEQIAITLVEGATFLDIKRLLAADPQIRKVLIDLAEPELLARLGANERSPEGLFFPDTYFLAKGGEDASVLRRAYDAQRQRLAAAWTKRPADSPLATPYDALILASIVEKETGRAEDRPLIASVLNNRLRSGMRLQADPTVIYGIGAKFDGNIRKRDLETDTPYNTYTRDGLPPTPIAMPSQASIDAAVNPPRTAYLYFVARGDGTSEFSTNLADHNRAVSKYQKGGR
jgi:UPF0755 protein